MIDAQLETVTRKIRSDSIKIGIASFLCGAGVTLLITLLVHPSADTPDFGTYSEQTPARTRRAPHTVA